MIRVADMVRSEPHWGQHVLAGAVSITIMVFMFIDRRAPVTVIEGEAVPGLVQAGSKVTFRWLTDWTRACEAISSREMVGSNLIIRSYLKDAIRIPVSLGRQMSEIEIAISPTQPSGLTAYRTTLRFHECGITSRIWPITVETPPIYFQVKE